MTLMRTLKIVSVSVRYLRLALTPNIHPQVDSFKPIAITSPQLASTEITLTLSCFDRTCAPREMVGVSTKTRLDLNKIGLEHIWEFVDSHELPSEWGKLDRDHLCYSSKIGKNSTHPTLPTLRKVSRTR